MKIQWMGIVLGATVAIAAQAQTAIGIKGGISIPNLTAGSASPVSKGYSSRLGPDAALFAVFHLSHTFSIQPEIDYSSQGGKKNGTQAIPVTPDRAVLFPPGQAPAFLYARFKSVAKLNYLMIPVLARFDFTLAYHWQWYVNGGPFAAFLLNAHNNTTGNSSLYTDEQLTQPLPIGEQSFNDKINIKNELHTFNTGIAANIGIDWLLKQGKIFLEAGGNYGFLNIQKGTANGKNNAGAAVIQAGYAFQLKH